MTRTACWPTRGWVRADGCPRDRPRSTRGSTRRWPDRSTSTAHRGARAARSTSARWRQAPRGSAGAPPTSRAWRQAWPGRLESVGAARERLTEKVGDLRRDVAQHVALDRVHRAIAPVEDVEALGGHAGAQDAAMAGVTATTNESALLELGDDGVHRLGRHEGPSRQLSTRHAVV